MPTVRVRGAEHRMNSTYNRDNGSFVSIINNDTGHHRDLWMRDYHWEKDQMGFTTIIFEVDGTIRNMTDNIQLWASE